MGMHPRNWLQYFYLNKFSAVTKVAYLYDYCLYFDIRCEDYNFRYQLYMTTDGNNYAPLNLLSNRNPKIDYFTHEDIEDLNCN